MQSEAPVERKRDLHTPSRLPGEGGAGSGAGTDLRWYLSGRRAVQTRFGAAPTCRVDSWPFPACRWLFAPEGAEQTQPCASGPQATVQVIRAQV